MKHFEATLKIPIRAICKESVENWIENLVLPCLNEYCNDEGLVANFDIKEINR